jgi:hypothetical protein
MIVRIIVKNIKNKHLLKWKWIHLKVIYLILTLIKI